MENKKLDAAESLELITRMIQSTQTNWERNAGRPSLIWGYVTIFVSLTIWSLVSVFGYHNPKLNYLWLAIPVIGGLLMYLTRSKEPPKGYKTYMDNMIKYTWIVLGIAVWFVSTIAFFSPIPILFLDILLISIATVLTGLITKFKIYTATGILGMLLSTLCLKYPGIDSCLIFAAEFALICVIPGHILNYRANQHV